MKLKKLLATLALVSCLSVAVAQSNNVHVVDRGETLESIAKAYNTTPQKIIELNPDVKQFIFVGMKLKVPTSVGINNARNTQASENYERYENTYTNTSGRISNSFSESSSEGRLDANGDIVEHYMFAIAQFMAGDFNYIEESGCYGLGLVASSISHWGAFHLGANVNFSVNAGLVHDWGCIIDFGPSVRLDICKNLFVNVPFNALCIVTFPEGTTDTDTDWGVRIAPSLHAFFSKKFGVFVGPQLSFDFSGKSSCSFGFQAGLSYSF